MQSTIKKHSVVIAGHKTSVSLENEFWDGLRKIVEARRSTLSDLLASLGPQGNLSSAIHYWFWNITVFSQKHVSGNQTTC